MPDASTSLMKTKFFIYYLGVREQKVMGSAGTPALRYLRGASRSRSPFTRATRRLSCGSRRRRRDDVCQLSRHLRDRALDDSVRNGSNLDQRPPTTSSDGHESRRWREQDAGTAQFLQLLLQAR